MIHALLEILKFICSSTGNEYIFYIVKYDKRGVIFLFTGLNVTLRYSKSVKIPLLEDVLNAIKGKGQLIYIEVSSYDR